MNLSASRVPQGVVALLWEKFSGHAKYFEERLENAPLPSSAILCESPSFSSLAFFSNLAAETLNALSTHYKLQTPPFRFATMDEAVELEALTLKNSGIIRNFRIANAWYIPPRQEIWGWRAGHIEFNSDNWKHYLQMKVNPADAKYIILKFLSILLHEYRHFLQHHVQFLGMKLVRHGAREAREVDANKYSKTLLSRIYFLPDLRALKLDADRRCRARHPTRYSPGGIRAAKAIIGGMKEKEA